MSAQDIADRAGLSVTLVRRVLRTPADCQTVRDIARTSADAILGIPLPARRGPGAPGLTDGRWLIGSRRDQTRGPLAGGGAGVRPHADHSSRVPVPAAVPALREGGDPVGEDVAAFGDAQPAGAADHLRRLFGLGAQQRSRYRAEDEVGTVAAVGRVLAQFGDVAGGRGVAAVADFASEVPAQLGRRGPVRLVRSELRQRRDWGGDVVRGHHRRWGARPPGGDRVAVAQRV
ncbi:hypothetical protein ABZ478_32925 [Streptomyces sp. NPDC005706]|uniref:hypothetical protein n=1 Tax=Streptomyces sp. NPDC005706 TaxID=3157169 RepID=UPI0033C624F7